MTRAMSTILKAADSRLPDPDPDPDVAASKLPSNTEASAADAASLLSRASLMAAEARRNCASRATRSLIVAGEWDHAKRVLSVTGLRDSTARSQDGFSSCGDEAIYSEEVEEAACEEDFADGEAGPVTDDEARSQTR